MAEPVAFQWDFERSELDDGARGFTTFSVGVFQWQPKSNGKGLKKSKTIRVAGYVAEPEKVYVKAEALCSQLNDAKAHADNPPTWLQKQYSVPRPDGLPKPKPDRLSSARVRSARRRIMTDRLLPEGFVAGTDGSYVRRVGEQIHLVNFQGSKYGGKFTVNLGFTYDFIPPLFQKRPLPLSGFHLLDCPFQERIGMFLPEHRDTWFEYGSDLHGIRATLNRCADESLRAIEDLENWWGQPSTVLEWLSGPKDPADPEEVALAQMESGRRLPLSQHLRWAWHSRELVCGCIATHDGRFDEAEDYLHRWISQSQVHSDRPVYEVLRDGIDASRNQPSQRESFLRRWVTLL